MFHVSYEIVTEKSAEYGDAEERGVISDNVCLRYAIEDVLAARSSVSAIEPSSADDPRWITVYYEMDPTTGDYENRSLHMPQELTPATRRRIVKLLKGK